jgi:hypothetical protein
MPDDTATAPEPTAPTEGGVQPVVDDAIHADAAVDDDARHLRVIMKRTRQLSPAGRAYLRSVMAVGDSIDGR